MNISVYQGKEHRKNNWKQADSFFEALEPLLQKAHCINVVGSGGKTTVIDTLSQEIAERNRTCVILTTTHRYAPKRYDCTGNNAECFDNMIAAERIAVIGTPCENGKITIPDKKIYGRAFQAADWMLTEADGSRHLPLKYPNQTEPVLTDDCQVCLIVAGLSGIGKGLGTCCHRADLMVGEYGASFDGRTIVTKEVIVWLITNGYIKRLQKQHPDILLAIILTQVESASDYQAGKDIIEQIAASETKLELGIVTSLICDTVY